MHQNLLTNIWTLLVASLLLVMFRPSLVLAGAPQRTEEREYSLFQPQPGCKRFGNYRCNVKAEQLMIRAKALEEKGTLDQAISMYEAIKRQHPTATYENEIVTATYSGDAQDRINVLRCRKARGPDFSTVSREQMGAEIHQAIEQGKEERLTRIASCDFTVGDYESDYYWHEPPDRVARLIFTVRQELNWSSRRFEDWGKNHTGFMVGVRDGAALLGFSLARIKGRWLWVGLATSDQTFLRRLDELAGRKQ